MVEKDTITLDAKISLVGGGKDASPNLNFSVWQLISFATPTCVSCGTKSANIHVPQKNNERFFHVDHTSPTNDRRGVVYEKRTAGEGDERKKKWRACVCRGYSGSGGSSIQGALLNI